MGDDEDVEGMPLDGLAYLRMVRKEAKTVPSLMVAGAEPVPFFEDAGEGEEGREAFGEIALKYEAELEEELKELDYLNYDDEVNDDEDEAKTEGSKEAKEENGEEEEEYGEEDYYDSDDDDEAFIAPPSPVIEKPATPHETWQNSTLVPVFTHLHEMFHSTPLSKIPPKLPYQIPVGVERWHKFVSESNIPPTFAFLRAVSHDNIVKGLKFITDRLKAGKDVDSSFTIWIWTLFIGVRPYGEIEEENLLTLRAIGKKCISILTKLNERKQLGEYIEEDEPAEEELPPVGSEEYIAEMKRRKYYHYDRKYRPTPNTLATLDMIIGLVGHVWRQRDLFMERIGHGLGKGWEFEDSAVLIEKMMAKKIEGVEKMLAEEQREQKEAEQTKVATAAPDLAATAVEEATTASHDSEDDGEIQE